MIQLVLSVALSTNIYADYCLSIFGCPDCNAYGCQYCPQGYFLSIFNYLQPFSICLPCPYGCTACEPGQCTACFPNFTLESGGQCSCDNQPCEPQSSQPCQPGTFASSLYSMCMPCPVTLNCITCSNATYCSQCPVGMGVSNPAVSNGLYTMACQLCPPFCLICGGSPLQCQQCLAEYANINGTCTCERENKNDCAKCSPSQYYDALTQVCNPCTPELHCAGCSNGAYCLDCYNGYFLSKNEYRTLAICTLCPPTCTTCTSPFACLACVDKTSTCLQLPCASAAPNCASCVQVQFNVLKCLQCQSGYFLSTQQQQCSPCLLNCLSCYSGTQCSHCSPGYYKSTPTKCQPCTANCTVCSEIGLCQSCAIGHYLVGGTCLTCAPNCQSCLSVAICSGCSKGYSLGEGLCQSEAQSSQRATVIGLAVSLLVVFLVGAAMGIYLWKS